MCPLQYRRVKSKGAPGLAFETWDPSNQFPLETPTPLFVIRSEAEGSAVPRTFRGNTEFAFKQNCHLDRSVPGFPATLHWKRPRVRLSVGKPHAVRQRH